jgi:F0F1-type ATP synthase beta subunit
MSAGNIVEIIGAVVDVEFPRDGVKRGLGVINSSSACSPLPE